jgi:hypothetical protein
MYTIIFHRRRRSLPDLFAPVHEGGRSVKTLRRYWKAERYIFIKKCVNELGCSIDEKTTTSIAHFLRPSLKLWAGRTRLPKLACS